jgi:riboflavin-specific deaminase-like protein
MNLNQQIDQWLQAAQKNFNAAERPFVTLSYAQSLDGSIALHNHAPLSLSGPESLCLTHQLRSMHDGILIGIGTVLSDDPQLTVRHWVGHNPQPIVLDSQLRIPAKARLCCLPDKRCWVLTTVDDK